MSLYTKGLARERLNDKQGALFLNANDCRSLKSFIHVPWRKKKITEYWNKWDSLTIFVVLFINLYLFILMEASVSDQKISTIFVLLRSRLHYLEKVAGSLSEENESLLDTSTLYCPNTLTLLKRPKENVASVWELLFFSQRSVHCLLRSSSLCCPMEEKRTVVSARQGGSYKSRKYQPVWNPN